MPTTEQDAISTMFDRIAESYDSTNRVLSFGQDLRLRAEVARFIPSEPNISLLDVATGTADLLITLCKLRPNIKTAVGVDLAENMLKIGHKKLVDQGLLGLASLQNADASDLPFERESFDVVTIAFGIRNVVAKERALQEFFRVLKPHGCLIILEFSMPERAAINKLYELYFRHILPRVGGWLSKNRDAYCYLNRSVEAFPRPHEFRKVLFNTGFTTVTLHQLTFGIATIYCARKG
jgi:demethylmenaquinone methyltransferase / 2-methoxy-6-polyprenyl-1,4-benzoquinol methylase